MRNRDTRVTTPGTVAGALRENPMSRSTKIRTVAVLMMGTMLIAGTLATAGERDRVSMTVTFADLNLDTEAGMKRLHYRLKRAARVACDLRGPRELGSLRAALLSRKCYEQMLEKAYEQIRAESLVRVDDPALRRLVRTRAGG